MLNVLYGGGLTAPDTSVEPKGLFIEFDQSEFITGTPESISMDAIGFAYIPSGCQDRTKQCKAYVAFYVCVQSR